MRKDKPQIQLVSKMLDLIGMLPGARAIVIIVSPEGTVAAGATGLSQVDAARLLKVSAERFLKQDSAVDINAEPLTKTAEDRMSA